jgi:hypothetical protein
MLKITQFPNFPNKKPFKEIHAVPCWLDGVLDPLIDPYELGIMCRASAFYFIGLLPEADEEICTKLGVSLEWWLDGRRRYIWANFKTDVEGWIRTMSKKSNQGTTAVKIRWANQKIKTQRRPI